VEPQQVGTLPSFLPRSRQAFSTGTAVALDLCIRAGGQGAASARRRGRPNQRRLGIFSISNRSTPQPVAAATITCRSRSRNGALGRILQRGIRAHAATSATTVTWASSPVSAASSSSPQV
jgi:hypothetical protein